MARGKYVTEKEAKEAKAHASKNKAASASHTKATKNSGGSGVGKLVIELKPAGDKKKMKGTGTTKQAARAAAAAADGEVAAADSKKSKSKSKKRVKKEATAEEKHAKYLAARAKQVAAAAALSDDEDDEEDEDFTEDPNATSDVDDDDIESADDSDIDEFGDDMDEEEEAAAAAAAQRPPIGKRLALPGGGDDASTVVAEKKKTGLTSAQKNAIRNRHLDARAARELSGLFGKMRGCKTRPSAFQSMVKEFVAAAPPDAARPRISRLALLYMQKAMEVVIRVSILPVAAEVLMVSQAYAAAATMEPALLEKKTEAARLEKKIMSRHMEYACRSFTRRVAPTMELVFDDNMVHVHAAEAIKTAKRIVRDLKVRRFTTIKARIAQLHAKEARFLNEAAAPDNVNLTDEERQELIEITLEFEIASLKMTKRKITKTAAAIASAELRLTQELPAEVAKARKAIAALNLRIPGIEEGIASLKEQIAADDKRNIAWLVANKEELAASAKAAKRTDEQKALRAEALAQRRALNGKRSHRDCLVKQLASVHSQIKKRTKSILVKKLEAPRLKERITKNRLLKAAAEAQAAGLAKAIRRSQSVQKDENAMDEDEEEEEEEEE